MPVYYDSYEEFERNYPDCRKLTPRDRHHFWWFTKPPHRAALLQKLIGDHNLRTLNDFAAECHAANQKWWQDAAGNKIERNKGELLCLVHSEISEAMEGERKNLNDTKLPHRRMAEVELVDALIRIFDYAAAYGYDLDGAYREKMAYNATREDHTHEHRAGPNGKKF